MTTDDGGRSAQEPTYGGFTAQELQTADAQATRDWSLDTAHDMVFVNNPREAVARFDLAFAERAMEDARVAILARNALPSLLARIAGLEAALASGRREIERLKAIEAAARTFDGADTYRDALHAGAALRAALRGAPHGEEEKA